MQYLSIIFKVCKSLFCCYDTTHDIHSLKEKRFNQAQGFRDFSPLPSGFKEETSHWKSNDVHIYLVPSSWDAEQRTAPEKHKVRTMHSIHGIGSTAHPGTHRNVFHNILGL